MKLFLLLFLLSFKLFSQENRPVILQLTWKYQFQFAGYIMAKEKGFYENAHLDVKIREYENNKNPIQEVKNGNAHFGISRSDLILERMNQGTKLVQMLALCQASPAVLQTVSSKGISSLSDLKGKKYLYYSDKTFIASITSMLKSFNLSEDDFTWIKAKSYSPLEITQSEADFVTGYSTISPYHLQKAGFTPIVFHPKDYGFDFYGDILFTHENTIQTSPKMVENFYQASLKGWEYAFANVEETIRVIKEKYNSQNFSQDLLEYEANAFKELAFFKGIPFGNINAIKLEKIANTFKLLGQTNSNINDFDSFIYKPLSKTNDIKLSVQEENYIKYNPVIKVGVNNHFKPIDFIDENGLHQGISQNILDFISQKSGLRFIYIPVTEELVENALKNREIDLYIDTVANKQKLFTVSKTGMDLLNESFLDTHTKSIDDIYFIMNYDALHLKSIFDKNLQMISDKQKESIKRQWIPKIIQTIDWTLIWQIASVLALVIIILLYKNIQQKKSEKLRLKAQVDEKTKDLTIALDEKALLLKELNHRVKNNMQMIISLLRLQGDKVKDEKLQSILLTIQNRINAMSHLHELLYTQDNITHIHADDYFELLIEDLKRGFESDVHIEYLISADLNVEQAIYIGIILNELVTNAIKYAFEDNEGLIQIELNKKDNLYILKVKDNGIGFTKTPNKNSLGMSLIQRLVTKQLKGEFQIQCDNGVEVQITWGKRK